MTEVISWFQAHGKDLIELWLQIIGAASIIVKLTPTVKDDTVLKKVVKITGKFVALNR